MIPTPEQEQVWREEWMATAASATSNEKRLLKWDSTMAGYMMGRRVAQAELEALRKDAETMRRISKFNYFSLSRWDKKDEATVFYAKVRLVNEGPDFISEWHSTPAEAIDAAIQEKQK